MTKLLSFLKKRLPIVISVLLLVFLLALILLLYLQTRKLEEVAVSKPDIGKRIAYEQENPIQKGFLEGNEGIIYQIEGSFVGDLSLADREDQAAEGVFVVRDDPLRRKIPVLLGLRTGRTLFGSYEGSFEATSMWRTVSTADLVKQIKPGEPVKLTAQAAFLKSGQKPDFMIHLEEVFDSLALEYESGDFNYEVPDDFILVPMRVGLTR